MSRFSATLMDHFNSPRNWGTLENATVVGAADVTGGARKMALYLLIEAGRVEEVAYNCHGCGVTIACGSVLTELVDKQDLSTCHRITKHDIIDGLDGVPADKRHCADLVYRTLQNALEHLAQG